MAEVFPVADGPKLVLVLVAPESVVVIAGVWKSVSCHRTKTALALSPPEVVMLVSVPPLVTVHTWFVSVLTEKHRLVEYHTNPSSV